MNPFYVKEEWSGSSFLNWTPVAMEGLNGTAPPPFLNKTYDLVDDSSTNFIVSWGKGNNSFVVWDPQLFSLNLLPRYFKHSNFSSFVRQLNTYGFKKVDPDKWEFANEGFLRGKRHLLKNIKRKRTTTSQSQFEDQDVVVPCIELGRFGADAEIDVLRRDKQVLMEELVKLKQEQKNFKAYLKAMEERVKGTERKQQQMASFLVKAMQNPIIVQKLIQQKDRKELEEVISNKRRRHIEYGNFNNTGELSSLGGRNDFVNNGIENYGEVTDIDDSELDRLAMEMQGSGGGLKNSDEGYLRKEEKGGEGGLDQRFWEDLMNDGNEQKFGSFGFDKEDEEFRLCGFWSGIQLGILSNDHLPARKELLVLQLEKEVDDEKAFSVAFDSFLFSLFLMFHWKSFISLCL